MVLNHLHTKRINENSIIILVWEGPERPTPVLTGIMYHLSSPPQVLRASGFPLESGGLTCTTPQPQCPHSTQTVPAPHQQIREQRSRAGAAPKVGSGGRNIFPKGKAGLGPEGYLNKPGRE